MDRTNENYEAIVIGASRGGMEALHAVLRHLPEDFSLSMVVVQHLHAGSGDFLADYLNGACKLKVKQADEKEGIVPGVIYVAPADYHLLVEEDRSFSLTIDAPVNYSRPSIDVLFEAAADVYGASLAGVILTGANADGSNGLKRIKELGGLAIAQDPETAEADVMPRAAIAATEVDHVLPVEQIGPFLAKLV